MTKLTIRYLPLVCIILLNTSNNSQAGNWYVATNGNNSAGTNWFTAYTNIQTALNGAGNNDTIHLAGHAFGITNTLVWSSRSNMTMRGGYAATNDTILPGPNNPALWPTFIRRAGGTIRMMSANSVTNGKLESVTITGGNLVSSPNGGAGIYIGNSRMTLSACTIASNTTANAAYNDQYGGGMLCNQSTVVISNCLILNNMYDAGQYTTVYGGGLCIMNSAVTMVRTLVVSNKVYIFRWGYADYGGGVAVLGNSTLVTRNCIFTGNNSYNSDPTFVSSVADALYCGGGTTLVENCTVANNYGEGIRRDGGVVNVRNSILWNNTDDIIGAVAVAYSDVQTTNDVSWTNGINGCISTNPLFVDQTYFHLQSKHGQYTNGYFSGGGWFVGSNYSPAIDGGDPTSPYKIEPMPHGKHINMGSYGNTPTADLSPIVDATLIYIK